MLENSIPVSDAVSLLNAVWSTTSSVEQAKSIAEHIVSSGGKRVRPMVVLLSAQACNVSGEQAIALAAMIELLHTATLLHDDVIDESAQRRGKPTANQHWGNEASVLVGDLLYARSFQLIAGLKHQNITQVIADATSDIVEGEVLQLMHCHDTTTTQEIYIDIFDKLDEELIKSLEKDLKVWAPGI